MDLESQLLREHSKKNTVKIAEWVGDDRRRLSTLMTLFLKGETLTAQRAAWVVSTLAEGHPGLFRRYLGRMLCRLQEPGIHDAVKRAVVRVLEDEDVPRELLGAAATVCFEQLSSAAAPIAVKCYSMTVLLHIAEEEPELGRELQLVIEQQLPYASAGFRARAKEVLNQLRTVVRSQ